MVGDADPAKWRYSEHTRSKHELLEKYLGGWIGILGSHNRKLLIVDGFAGKGAYDEGEDGSPVIIHRKALELIEAGRVDEVICVFVEDNEDNYRDLQRVLAGLPPTPGIKIVSPRPAEFESVVEELFTLGIGIPSFWFIEPFGFSDFSFETVSKIMSLNRSEVFFNFMVSFIQRFLDHPDLDGTYDRLFGTMDWRQIVESSDSGVAKEKALRDLYTDQLRNAGCRVTNFRVCMDDKRQTLYYLVHATRHQLGVWLMRDVMSKQGPSGIFAYLGPDDGAMRFQQRFIPVQDIPALKIQLLTQFAGRTIAYIQLTDECSFDGNELPQRDYRNALKALETESKLRVERITSKKTGLSGQDRIIFP